MIDSLIQLQNRGYDSSGVTTLDKNNHFCIYKFASTNEKTSIEKLIELHLESNESHVGMGHNRWATHGGKTDINAHPHISCNKQIAIVHNGIIENCVTLKKRLIKKGFSFYSETDTEVIANLIAFYYEETRETETAIQKTILDLDGTYGLIILNKDEPNKLYAIRNGSPMLLGFTEKYAIVTSEQSGFCSLVNTYITLNNDDLCVIELLNDSTLKIKTNLQYTLKNVSVSLSDLTPSPYTHWTLKEIFDQPVAIINSINRGGRIQNEHSVKLGGLEKNMDLLKKTNNIVILGCGTSFHAGLYGMHFMKNICNFNTVVVLDGADFTVQDVPTIGSTILILITQSGETKDLHRCIKIAKDNNLFTIGIVNVVDSLIAREVDCGIYCNSGREMGVASTKAYTSQVVCLALLSIWFAQINDINKHKRAKLIQDLQNLSNHYTLTLENVESEIKNLATTFTRYNNVFLLGKGTDEVIAREGSLKIKEISYIHSEAYSASSLKHGPFALLDEYFPTILLNCCNEHESKIINCFEQVHSRNSPIVFITNNAKIKLNKDRDCRMITIPKNDSFSSLLALIPLQLLAYHLSINKNINPDIPKNLAKVVSVE